MIIDRVTYLAKGEVAGLDDIITLRLKYIDREGGVIGTEMISGHSPALNNSVYEMAPVDVDKIWIEATDLDYEGHTIKIHNYEYALPKTGSRTATFKIEPVGAPEVTAVAMPEAEKFAEVTKLTLEGEPAVEVVKPMLGGAGLALIAIIVIWALSRRKKK